MCVCVKRLRSRIYNYSNRMPRCFSRCTGCLVSINGCTDRGLYRDIT